MERVRALFREYADWLAIDLSFQDFEAELAGLPGCYAAPGGGLYLAETRTGAGNDPAGCVGFRPFSEGICEMKRLWVRPAFQGSGLGRLLAETAVAAARKAGYERMRLDTLPHMHAAMALYRRLGFVDIPPYRLNPVPGTAYFELDLTQAP